MSSPLILGVLCSILITTKRVTSSLVPSFESSAAAHTQVSEANQIAQQEITEGWKEQQVTCAQNNFLETQVDEPGTVYKLTNQKYHTTKDEEYTLLSLNHDLKIITNLFEGHQDPEQNHGIFPPKQEHIDLIEDIQHKILVLKELKLLELGQIGRAHV